MAGNCLVVTLISSRLMPEFSDSNMKMYKIDGWFIKFRGVEVTCFVIIEMITFIFVQVFITRSNAFIISIFISITFVTSF